MRTGGELLTCELCGATAFRPTGKSDPKGWNPAHMFGLLCPECYSGYVAALEEFKRLRKAEVYERKEGLIFYVP